MNLKKTLSVLHCCDVPFRWRHFPVGYAAQPKDAGSLILRYDAMVARKPDSTGGKYNIQWKTHSPEATVTFMHGEQDCGDRRREIVDRGTKYPANEVVYDQGNDGTRAISRDSFWRIEPKSSCSTSRSHGIRGTGYGVRETGVSEFGFLLSAEG